MMKPNQENKITAAGFAITFTGAVLFSTKAILVKKAFGNTHTDALTLLTLRMLFSLPFYVASTIITSNKKDNTRMSLKQWSHVVMLGIFGYYLSSLFDFVGLQ